MTERRGYMMMVTTAAFSFTLPFYIFAFTGFTLPFTSLDTGRAASTAILLMLCVACLLMHYTALKKSWIVPDAGIGIISGAVPAALYGTMVAVKYSSAFLIAAAAAAVMSVMLLHGAGNSKVIRRAVRRALFYIWTVILFSASFFTFKCNDTRMTEHDVYSAILSADSELRYKEIYSRNRLCSLLPDSIGDDVPFVVEYSYLPPGEKVRIDGIFIRVSVQYAEKVSGEEMYAAIRRTLHENAPAHSSLQYGKIVSC